MSGLHSRESERQMKLMTFPEALQWAVERAEAAGDTEIANDLRIHLEVADATPVRVSIEDRNWAVTR